MSVLVRDGSAAKAVSAINVRGADSSLKIGVSAWMRTAAGALKLIWSSYVVTPSTTYIEGNVGSYRSTLAITPKVTAQVEGGVAPYSYAWQQTSGSSGWVINDANKAAASFQIYLNTGEEETATFNCIVTDASGASLTTATVTAECSNGWLA